MDTNVLNRKELRNFLGSSCFALLPENVCGTIHLSN